MNATTQIQTPRATARVIKTYRSSRNETHTWEVHIGGRVHRVFSSKIYAPAETLVFPVGSNCEVAGGPGMSHESAMRAYLASL